MRPEAELIIARAYVNYANTCKFDQHKFAAFVGDFPEVLGDVSREQLKKAIHSYGEAFIDDINPVLDMAQVRELTDQKSATEEFFNTLPSTRKADVVQHFQKHQFKSASARKQVRAALLTVYGVEDTAAAPEDNAALTQDLADITGDTPADALGPLPGSPTDAMTDSALGAGADLGADAGLGGGMGSETLPPDLEDKSLHTIEKYLMQDVFNNKIIPKVSIVNAWKLQNGYVIRLQFAAQDDSKKVYTHAVIYNDKIVLPAELTADEDGKQVLGEFNKETFLNEFAEQQSGKPASKENYSDLMTQMISSPVPVAAKTLDLIVRKFGQEAGYEAFDSYTRIMHKKDAKTPTGAMRVEATLNQAELSDTIDEAHFFNEEDNRINAMAARIKSGIALPDSVDLDKKNALAEIQAASTQGPTDANTLIATINKLITEKGIPEATIFSLAREKSVLYNLPVFRIIRDLNAQSLADLNKFSQTAKLKSGAVISDDELKVKPPKQAPPAKPAKPAIMEAPKLYSEEEDDNV